MVLLVEWERDRDRERNMITEMKVELASLFSVNLLYMYIHVAIEGLFDAFLIYVHISDGGTSRYSDEWC